MTCRPLRIVGSYRQHALGRAAQSLALLSGLMATAALGGCSSFGDLAWFGNFTGAAGTGEVAITRADGASLNAKYPAAIYSYIDTNTADVYLTDLPLARLADRNDTLADVSGTVVHVYVFLVPVAGKSPIDPTACNATVRQFVFASGARGLYAGAGFASTSDLGDETFGASIVNASMRLSAASADFADKLGPANLAGSFVARQDAEGCKVLADRLAMIAATTPVLNKK